MQRFSQELFAPTLNGITVSAKHVFPMPVVLHARIGDEMCHM